MTGHYLVVLHLPDERRIRVGALGTHDFPPGDYVYVGSAQRALGARVARHRRIDKPAHWHLDHLRPHARWIEARVLAAARGPECGLAEQLASRPGAVRAVAGFGASDCRCPGHLVAFPGGVPTLPGTLETGEGVEARFVERPNRFVALARLPGGDVVRTHLPNTGRLIGQLPAGCPLILRPASDPGRRTRFTATRAWTGSGWLSLEAAAAPHLFVDWLSRHPILPGLGAVCGVEREVTVKGRRLDLRLTFEGGRECLVEVKSLTTSFGGRAVFSRTPSARGAAHLDLLGDLRERGADTAAIFVVQRGDVSELAVDAGADPGWIQAILRAADRGVRIRAYRCRVAPAAAWVEGPIPVDLGLLDTDPRPATP